MAKNAMAGHRVLPVIYSNRDLGNPDCLMIDSSVPTLSSLWSGTGTVMVLPSSAFCMMMWLPLRRTSLNPSAASIPQASRPDSTRSLANHHLNLCHIHFIMQAVLNFGS